MNSVVRYAVFILVMGAIILLLAGVAPRFYETIIGVARVARIAVHSELSIDSSFLTGTASVDSIISQIKSADADPEISAILLDINSPGGGAVASYELAKAVKSVSKPVVSVIREMGASGAYWAAASGDYVFATEISIVGSVGVTGSYLVFEELMEKYGVSEVRAVSGEKKDFGSPYRNITNEELEDFEELINETFTFFVSNLLESRSFSEEALEEVKSGKIFLGAQALEFGLIDAVGGMEEAEYYLMQLLGVNEIEFVEQSFELTLFDLLTNIKNNSPSVFFADPVTSLLRAS
jgi:protease-4